MASFPIRANATRDGTLDLSDIVGTWVDDPEFDEAMKDFERVDREYSPRATAIP
jgi:hypothetical protein